MLKCVFQIPDNTNTTDSFMYTHTTKPWEDDGTDTATLIPWSVLCSLRMAILRCISASDFGAFIVAAPRYVTPEKIVHSWSISETKRVFRYDC